MTDTIEYLKELTEKDCEACPEMALDRITYAIVEIERLTAENRAMRAVYEAAEGVAINKGTGRKVAIAILIDVLDAVSALQDEDKLTDYTHYSLDEGL